MEKLIRNGGLFLFMFICLPAFEDSAYFDDLIYICSVH